MPTQTQPNAVILERIATMQSDITDIKSTVNTHCTEQNEFIRLYTERHERVVQMSQRAHERIDEHERRLQDLEHAIEDMQKAVQPLVLQAKIIGWFAMVLGASVVALIWSILTHQIQVVFP